MGTILTTFVGLYMLTFFTIFMWKGLQYGMSFILLESDGAAGQRRTKQIIETVGFILTLLFTSYMLSSGHSLLKIGVMLFFAELMYVYMFFEALFVKKSISLTRSILMTVVVMMILVSLNNMVYDIFV